MWHSSRNLMDHNASEEHFSSPLLSFGPCVHQRHQNSRSQLLAGLKHLFQSAAASADTWNIHCCSRSCLDYYQKPPSTSSEVAHSMWHSSRNLMRRVVRCRFGSLSTLWFESISKKKDLDKFRKGRPWCGTQFQ